jgi:glycogen debranching enzyme
VIVPVGECWQTEIIAQPTVGNQRFQAVSPGEHYNVSAPGRKIEAWRDTATDIAASDPALTRVLRRTESDLGALQMHDESGNARPFVAAGAPWFMTLFGRDSLLTAWMALPLEVDLALGTLEQLAELQGQDVNPLTEEEPGRIMHEMRRGPAGGQVFGGNIYYGSADATPLFVMLLAECHRWGADSEVIRQLLPAADAALRWITDYGDRDGDGFVEYRRATDRPGRAGRGVRRPAPGRPAARTRRGVAGQVRRAVLAARPWLVRRGAGRWQAAGRRADQQCGALSLVGYRHRRARGRAGGAHGGPRDGLRLRAAHLGLEYGRLQPDELSLAVAGLLRYRHVPGAVKLATRLATGLLDAAAAFEGRLPELFCGFPRSRFATPVPYPTSCSPQAWASAAPLLLVRSFLGLDPDTPSRTLTVRPQLPARWGKVSLRALRLGATTVDLEAEGAQITAARVPDDWRLVTR